MVWFTKYILQLKLLECCLKFAVYHLNIRRNRRNVKFKVLLYSALQYTIFNMCVLTIYMHTL